MGTRYLLQHEMQIGNTACDDNLICLVGICEAAACIASIVDEDMGHLLHQLADAIFTSVCACMQTQHSVQLEARDKGEVPVFDFAPPTLVMMVPGQVMMAPPQQQQFAYAQPQQQMAYAQPGQVMYGAPQPQQVMYAAPGQQVYANPMMMQPQPVYGAPGQGAMMMQK